MAGGGAQYLKAGGPEEAVLKPPKRFKIRTRGGQCFWVPIVVLSLACLGVVEASSASSPGSLSYPPSFYVGLAAGAIALISLGVTIYYHGRKSGDVMRGALDGLMPVF